MLRQNILSFNIKYLVCESEPGKPRKSRLYSRARASAGGAKCLYRTPLAPTMRCFLCSRLRRYDIRSYEFARTHYASHIVCIRISGDSSGSPVRLSTCGAKFTRHFRGFGCASSVKKDRERAFAAIPTPRSVANGLANASLPLIRTNSASYWKFSRLRRIEW
jgi:hypothetical protein